MANAVEKTVDWSDRVARTIEERGSLLCVGLDPVYDNFTSRQRGGGVAADLVNFNINIIDQAGEFAAAFKPQYKCYSSEGEEGIAALRTTIDYIRARYPAVPVILDAKYADIGSTLERCAREAFDLFGADAVTAMPQPGKQALQPLLSREGKGCFMVVRTSNPGAEELQDISLPDGEPLYVEVARRIAAGWNSSGNVGLVGPATEPPVLRKIRQAAPDLPILCPGVGAQGGDLEAAVSAGLDSRGAGLLVNVSRGISDASDPGETARRLRDSLQAARLRHAGIKTDGDTQVAAVVADLFRIGAIRFEPVTLKSGLVSPYYNNLRIIASYPDLLRRVSGLMARTLEQAGVQPDILIGIAEAGIPLAVALSQYTGLPAGYVRSAAKAHGTKRMVEGAWSEGATAVLVDDVVSDGASKLEVLGHLQEAGLRVRDIVVLVDRGQGGVETMAAHGLRCHAAVKMEDVLSTLRAEGLITETQVEESRQFMRDAQAITASQSLEKRA